MSFGPRDAGKLCNFFFFAFEKNAIYYATSVDGEIWGENNNKKKKNQEIRVKRRSSHTTVPTRV